MVVYPGRAGRRSEGFRQVLVVPPVYLASPVYRATRRCRGSNEILNTGGLNLREVGGSGQKKVVGLSAALGYHVRS